MVVRLGNIKKIALKRKLAIIFLTLVVCYAIYKGLRELLWVTHAKAKIDNIAEVKLRIDDDIIGFQDFNCDKSITLANNHTNATIHISYISLEKNLYFFIDSIKKTISILDQFSGENIYDYSTLKLITKVDCFKQFGGCGGYNDSCLSKFKKPDLVFDNTGFHR